ncbi:hypothetical protein CF115_08940 [Aeromonas veronii]|nr:hypothetical protein CF115_08940 [Aeromonas veronii]
MRCIEKLQREAGEKKSVQHINGAWEIQKKNRAGWCAGKRDRVYRRGGANRDKWAEPRLSIWRMALQIRQGAVMRKRAQKQKTGQGRFFVVQTRRSLHQVD